jgi:hypothetical protein
MSYLLFAGNDYYPLGGAEDFKGSFETLERAVSAHNSTEYEYDGGWANILNTESLKIEKSFNRGQWFEKGYLDRFEPD